jgi:hypothetical protein
LLVLPLTLAAGSAHAVPSQIAWADTGVSGGPITFTAASPLCTSGTVRDVGGTIGIKMQHTCADGSGTFEFEVIGTGHFHFSAAGTGRYASLRGTGSCSLTQNQDGTVTRSCHALADFDNVAPSARITNVDVLIANRFSRVAATLETSDNVQGNAVSYRLSVTAAGHALGHAIGSTSGGSVAASVRVKLPKHVRRFALSLKVSDPLHNSRTVTRSLRVHR